MIVARASAVVAGLGGHVSAWAVPFGALEAEVMWGEPTDAPATDVLSRVAATVARRANIDRTIRVVRAPHAALGASAAVAVASWRLCAVHDDDALATICAAIEDVQGFHDAESVGAALRERPVVCVSQHPPRVQVLTRSDDLWLTVAIGTWPFDREAWRKALPANVPMGRVLDSVRRAAALPVAWASGDIDTLSAALDDRWVTPALGRNIPGSFPTLRAAREAGAIAAGLAAGGGAIAAISTQATTAAAVAEAMEAALVAHSNFSWVGSAPMGADR